MVEWTNGVPVLVLDSGENITGAGDMLDRMAGARFNNGCDAMAVYRESLGAAFFDLKTGLAGEMLQKFSNYGMRLAVIGDFSGEKSESLRAFIRESNRGGRVFFKASLEEALAALGAGTGGRAP